MISADLIEILKALPPESTVRIKLYSPFFEELKKEGELFNFFGSSYFDTPLEISCYECEDSDNVSLMSQVHPDFERDYSQLYLLDTAFQE